MRHLALAKQKTETEEKIAALEHRVSTLEEYAFNAGAFAVLAGLVMLGYECFRWLQSGDWSPARTWQLGRALINQTWLDAPTTWVGLHKIVVYILDLPVFATYPVMGWLVASGILISLKDDALKQIEKLRTKGRDQSRPDAQNE